MNTSNFEEPTYHSVHDHLNFSVPTISSVSAKSNCNTVCKSVNCMLPCSQCLCNLLCFYVFKGDLSLDGTNNLVDQFGGPQKLTLQMSTTPASSHGLNN